MADTTHPVDAPNPIIRTMSRRVGKGILYGFLILSSVIAMLPFFWMISTSLMSAGDALNKRWFPTAIDWDSVNAGLFKLPVPDNYIVALDTADFGKFFTNSVIITSVTIVGMLVMSILAGYAFGRIKFFGRNAIFLLLLATLMIPAEVTLIPNFITIRGDTVPLPDFALTSDGLTGSWQAGNSWLNTLYALTVPFMASPFIIFLLRQFFAQIPDELWDAARIDGAGHFRFLIQICLPIARPAVMTAVLLTFVQSWNAFMWPLIVTTEDVWRPIMVGLYNFVSERGSEVHLLMAASLITILPMLIVYFFTQKSFTEGIATSGLKG
jgi:ABC-type glycerol-3-phosphate transport system permease component